MKILFSSFNSTTLDCLKFLAEGQKIYTFLDKRAIDISIHSIEVIRVGYRSYWLSLIFHHLKLNIICPEYISNSYDNLLRIDPNVMVVSDFYNFTFYQFLKYKKKHHGTRLYLWSETRRWPTFWLSRWLMYSFWWYFKRNIHHVEKVFVFTKEGKKFFNDNAPEVNVEIIPAPIDTTLFYPATEKNWMPDQKLRVLMNARFIPLKEHKTLFRAVKQLKEQKIDVQVSLIGRGGHLKEELMEYAKELGISRQLVLLDAVAPDELRAVYLEHDVLVLPSNREAIGMVVPEAMACGVPTITSKAVGANTYVEEGVTGFVFDTGNANELADKLAKIAKPRVAQKMGEAAAKVIQEKYTKEILGERLLAALSTDAERRVVSVGEKEE